MYYPVHLDISYNTDTEYRDAVRQLMSMKPQPPLSSCSEAVDMDPITLDEMDMDDAAVTSFMDFVYEHTKTDYACMTLYQLAAATMFSEDPSIGLAVLCSYSYLREFHQAMRTLFLNIPSEDNPALQALIARLKR